MLRAFYHCISFARVVSLLWIPIYLGAQDLPVSGTITNFAGAVQIQKAGTEEGVEITPETKIESGDILATDEGAQAEVDLGGLGLVIIGSASQIEFGGMELEEGTPAIPALNIIAGGIKVNWKSEEGIVVATEQGMAYSQGGVFVGLIPEEGLTLFTAQSGGIQVQNADGEGVDVEEGQFTQLANGEDPSSPEELYDEVDAAVNSKFQDLSKKKKEGEEKTDEEGKDEDGIPDSLKNKSNYEEDAMVKPFFKVVQIVKKIRELEGFNTISYREPYYNKPLQKGTFFVETRLGFLTAASQDPTSYMGGRFRFGMQLETIALGLNYPVETQAGGGLKVVSLSGVPGILDKIFYLDYQSKGMGLDIHFGEIRDFTLHRGALVSNLSNELRSQIEQPLGMMISYTPNFLNTVTIFSPDVGGASIWGGSYTFDNGFTRIGVASITDLNQAEGYTYGDSVFRGPELPSPLNTSETKTIVATELFSEFDLVQHEQIHAFIYLGYSFYLAGGKALGHVAQAPGIFLTYRRMAVYLEGIINVGRAHQRYFNEWYLEDRTRVTGSRSVSQSDRHPPMGLFTRGFKTGVDWQMMDQLWMGMDYGQNIGSRSEGDENTAGELKKLFELNPNRTMNFRIFSGNGLFSGLEQAKLYYTVQGAGFGRTITTTPEDRDYPHIRSKDSESFFKSLNMEYGFLMEYSIMANSTIFFQFRSYSLDLDSDGIVGDDDGIMEFILSWRMKF